jgi:hypothetical protein
MGRRAEVEGVEGMGGLDLALVSLVFLARSFVCRAEDFSYSINPTQSSAGPTEEKKTAKRGNRGYSNAADEGPSTLYARTQKCQAYSKLRE